MNQFKQSSIRFALVIGLSLASLIGTPQGASTAFAETASESVSILDLHPTQPVAGFQSVEFTRNKKIGKIDSLEELRKKIQGLGALRAVKAPGGQVFLTDGHHRALAVFQATEELCGKLYESDLKATCMRETKVPLKIDADLSKSTWAEFSNFMIKTQNSFIPEEWREKLRRGELLPEQIFRQPGGYMPVTLGELKNSPMRSAIGKIFAELKPSINGDDFENFLEFLVAERLDPKDQLPAGKEADEKDIERLKKAIFENPKIVRFLRCSARRDDASWKRAQETISQAIGAADKNPGDFKPSDCETDEAKKCVSTLTNVIQSLGPPACAQVK